MDFVEQTLEPVFNEKSRILILGTIPSPKSRESGFYYGHPQNRFWKVISDIFDEPLPKTIDEKKNILLSNNIALWDVLKSCCIEKASDTSIKNPIPNDIKGFIDKTNIKFIFTTGKKAYNLYNKFCFNSTKINAVCLPSTSPANCKMSYNDIFKEYSVLLAYIR